MSSGFEPAAAAQICLDGICKSRPDNADGREGVQALQSHKSVQFSPDRMRFLRAELPRILATPCDVLSPRMVHPLLLRQRYGEQSWRGRNAGRRPAAKIVRNLPEPAVLTGGLLSSRPLLIDP